MIQIMLADFFAGATRPCAQKPGFAEKARLLDCIVTTQAAAEQLSCKKNGSSFPWKDEPFFLPERSRRLGGLIAWALFAGRHRHH